MIINLETSDETVYVILPSNRSVEINPKTDAIVIRPFAGPKDRLLGDSADRAKAGKAIGSRHGR